MPQSFSRWRRPRVGGALAVRECTVCFDHEQGGTAIETSDSYWTWHSLVQSSRTQSISGCAASCVFANSGTQVFHGLSFKQTWNAPSPIRQSLDALMQAVKSPPHSVAR